MHYEDIYQAANTVADEAISDAQMINAEMARLDARCGSIWVGDGFIATRTSNRRILDYYGGFEYVAEHCVMVLGDYVFYSDADDRVAEHIEHYQDSGNTEAQRYEIAESYQGGDRTYTVCLDDEPICDYSTREAARAYINKQLQEKQ